MITQTSTKLSILCNFIGSSISLNSIKGLPNYPISLNYGFDFDEEELGRELLAPLADKIAEQSIPIIEPEDFDSLYKWFIS